MLGYKYSSLVRSYWGDQYDKVDLQLNVERGCDDEDDDYKDKECSLRYCRRGNTMRKKQKQKKKKKRKDNSHGSVLGDVAGNTTNESANGLTPQHKT